MFTDGDFELTETHPHPPTVCTVNFAGWRLPQALAAPQLWLPCLPRRASQNHVYLSVRENEAVAHGGIGAVCVQGWDVCLQPRSVHLLYNFWTPGALGKPRPCSNL